MGFKGSPESVCGVQASWSSPVLHVSEAWTKSLWSQLAAGESGREQHLFWGSQCPEMVLLGRPWRGGFASISCARVGRKLPCLNCHLQQLVGWCVWLSTSHCTWAGTVLHLGHPFYLLQEGNIDLSERSLGLSAWRVLDARVDGPM